MLKNTVDIDKIQKPEIKSIAVTCNTFKRPAALEKCLLSLKKLKKPEGVNVEIIVVENDKEACAKTIVEKSAQTSEYKIHYFTEEQRGLCYARNRLLKEAINIKATHIAILDDDDIADENWLLNLVEMYNNHPNASIISGPEYSVFDKEYPKYLTNNNIFVKSSTKEKGEIRPTSSTHNSFFPVDIMTKSGIWFDSSFIFMGGEDGEFFNRAKNSGYIIAYNPEAIVNEINDENRVNVKWILNRNFYNGYSGSYIKYKGKNQIFKRYFYSIKTAFVTVLNIIFIPFSILGGLTFFFNIIGLTFKNAGKFLGAIFQKPLNYYEHLNGGINKCR